MAERPIRRLPRLMPAGEHEPAASDDTSFTDEEGVAEMAVLSNVSPSNGPVSLFIAAVSNSALAATLQGANR